MGNFAKEMEKIAAIAYSLLLFVYCNRGYYRREKMWKCNKITVDFYHYLYMCLCLNSLG